MTEVYWEAQYADGSVLTDLHGGRYGDIDRDRLTAFRLLSPSGILLELPTPTDYLRGHGLIYRKRSWVSAESGEQALSVVLAGWLPQGPVWVVDPAQEAVWVADGFVAGHELLDTPLFSANQGEGRIIAWSK